MCYACGTSLPVKERIGFRDLCPDCALPLHVCRNCRFYKPGAHWDCVETVGEPVTDKEKANFCEWFVPLPPSSKGAGDAAPKTGSARSKFDELFNG